MVIGVSTNLLEQNILWLAIRIIGYQSPHSTDNDLSFELRLPLFDLSFRSPFGAYYVF